MSIFQYNNYKLFLTKNIEQNQHKRGYKKMLADAAKCQKSYLSNVIVVDGDTHFSIEQGHALAVFWGMTDSETEYWLDLISYVRAGTIPLKNQIKKRLIRLAKEQARLDKRFKEEQIDRSDLENKYYSSWFWAAIHIIVEIPQYKTVEEIAARLHLPREVVIKTLNELKAYKLVKNKGPVWSINTGNIHLPSTSPLIGPFHINWRHRAIIDIQNNSKDSLHYSVIQSHSNETFEKIKTLLMNDLTKMKSLVSSSPAEDVTCLCLDFFKV